MIGEADILAHFEEQAGWNETLGSPFTAALCRAMASDYTAQGPIYELCKDWRTNPRKDALGLRIAGALHHAMLRGDASVLAATFPAMSPNWEINAVWSAARAYLAENTDQVREFIKSPPQTNETRRAIALLPGFLELAARFQMPMDLLELGASAGLNMNWDRFNYRTDSWHRTGDSDVTITTDWNGAPPTHLGAIPDIRSRAACDLNPLDVRDRDQALRLKCYTWADQTERLERLDAAIRLAVETGYSVEKANARDWLTEKLSLRPASGLTVIYHSVFLIYPPRNVIGEIFSLIEAAGKQATKNNPIAWLCYEPESLFGGNKSSPKMHARLQVWPDGAARNLNTSDGHVTKLISHEA